MHFIPIATTELSPGLSFFQAQTKPPLNCEVVDVDYEVSRGIQPTC